MSVFDGNRGFGRRHPHTATRASLVVCFYCFSLIVEFFNDFPVRHGAKGHFSRLFVGPVATTEGLGVDYFGTWGIVIHAITTR